MTQLTDRWQLIAVKHAIIKAEKALMELPSAQPEIMEHNKIEKGEL